MATLDSLTAGLDASQTRAVTFAEPRPLCVLAGPGSGKTRVLTRRIALRCATGTASPDHTVAVTFTRKAALELRHRLIELGLNDGITTGTFHSLAYAELRRVWRDRGISSPTLLTRTTKAVADLLPEGSDLGEIRRVTEELAWASALDLEPGRYVSEAQRQARRLPLPAERIGELIDDYARWKQRRNLIDFDDLLRLFTTELRDNPDYRAAIKWRHRHFHIDEFQDLSPLQFALVSEWSDTDIFAVGDPNQAIFGWNGGDSTYLTRFAQHFAGAETIRLECSYRSTPQILDGAYAVLDREGAKVRPLCNRQAGPAPEISAHADELDEAAALARRVRDQRGPNGAWSSQAVLVRTREQIAVIAEALRKAAIPHVVRDDRAFANRPEISAALENMYDGDCRLSTEIADLRAEIGPAGQDLEAVNLRLLCELGLDHLRLDPDASARSFVQWVRATYRHQGLDTAANAVEIVTFHAAKGLEWNAVHVAGAERGLLPIHHATTNAARNEERRLLFVAMTRAQNRLHISWARTRRFGDEVFERSRSPLLAPLIESNERGAAASPTSPGQPAGLREARRALSSTADA